VTEVALALAAPAPAALLTFWGVIVLVFKTQPVRPYTDGAWAIGDLISLGVLGGVIGFVSRPIPAAVGTALGLAAAVALQLYVLAGQAVYQAVVVADLTEATWTTSVARALFVAVATMTSGYVVTRVAVGRLRARQPARPIVWLAAEPRARVAAEVALVALTAILIPGVLVGSSLLTTARSAYLPAEGEPTINVVYEDDGTLTSAPESVPAGRVTIVAHGTPPLDYLSLYGPLSTDVVEAEDVAASFQQKRQVSGFGCCYWNHRIPRAELSEPGTYAFVALDRDWVPPEDQAAWEAWNKIEPISDIRLLKVTGPEPRPGLSTEAGGAGGRYLTLGALAALGIEAWAVGGALLLRPRRHPGPRTRKVVIAVAIGVVSGGFTGLLAMLAISQSHSPF
jgi:hypothetical protein